MIRRVTEYMIHCDAAKIGKECRTDGSWNAFDARTAEECAASATRDGWTQISKRFWLCPRCSAEQKTQAASE